MWQGWVAAFCNPTWRTNMLGNEKAVNSAYLLQARGRSLPNYAQNAKNARLAGH